MNKSRCPHCHAKLGNFYYADACPHCHQELKHNTTRLVAPAPRELHPTHSWPVRLFFSMVRLVES